MSSQAKYLNIFRKTGMISIGNEKISYEVKRRNVKYPRLEFFGRKLIVILPPNYKDEREIIGKKLSWIYRKYKYLSSLIREDLKNKFYIFGKEKEIKIDNNLVIFENKTFSKKEFIKYLKNILLEKIKNLVSEYSKELNVKVKKIIIRSQKTKLASFSSNHTLSCNIKLVSLKEKLIEYVIYHEMLHFFEKSHNPIFIEMIKKKFKDFEKIEEELKSFWISMMENEVWKKLLDKDI